jgi:hypothetical protein
VQSRRRSPDASCVMRLDLYMGSGSGVSDGDGDDGDNREPEGVR